MTSRKMYKVGYRVRNESRAYTELCRHARYGECRAPEGTCLFAHRPEQLVPLDDEMLSETERQAKHTTWNPRHPMYKRFLCPQFDSSQPRKSCPAGRYCQYAHGRAELQISVEEEMARAQHAPWTRMYRMRACLQYTQTGQCPQGKYCNYAHDMTYIMPLHWALLAADSPELSRPRLTNEEIYHRDHTYNALSPLYQTQVCEVWRAGLPCLAGEFCNHSHAPEPRVQLGDYVTDVATPLDERELVARQKHYIDRLPHDYTRQCPIVTTENKMACGNGRMCLYEHGSVRPDRLLTERQRYARDYTFNPEWRYFRQLPCRYGSECLDAPYCNYTHH